MNKLLPVLIYKYNPATLKTITYKTTYELLLTINPYTVYL